MKKFLIILFVLFIPLTALHAQNQGMVPKNMKESIQAMDEHLTKEEQKDFLRHREDDLVHAYNLSVGAYVRSHWGLNDESSKLHEFFVERGIEDAHTMSNIILVSYYRVKTNQLINLEQQIEEYIGEKHLHKIKKKLHKEGKEI